MILDRIFSRPDVEERDFEVLVEMVNTRKAETGGIVVSTGSAMTYSAVFACIRVLAETVASLPWIIYEDKGEKGRSRAKDYYLYPILHDQPNQYMSSFEYRETIMCHLLQYGNALSQVEYDARGRIESLWPLDPSKVLSYRIQNGVRQYFYQNPDGGIDWISGDNIWHLRGLSSDGLWGYSPITLMRKAIGLGMAAEDFGARFFANDATPGGLLIHPGQLGDKARENLKASWEDAQMGLSKKHRIAVLEEGLKYEKIGIPPEDAQFLETRKFQVTEIARIYRVPPHMLADLERATFSNIEHQSIDFVVHSLRPWLVRWEQSANLNLLLPSERKRYYSEFLVDGLLRGDTATRYTAYSQGIQAGWMTRADAREKENLNPIPGLEAPLVPLNMFPLGEEPESSEEGDQGRGGVRGGEMRRATEQRARDAAGKRHRLMTSYRRVYLDTAARILRREKNDVGAAVRKMIATQGFAAFRLWLDDFYREHVDFIKQQMMPVGKTYGEQVADLAAQEIERQADPNAVERFTESYVGGYAARHVGISQTRMQQAYDRSVSEESDLEQALLDELESWPEQRAAVIADEEGVRFNNAMAITMYASLGVRFWRSIAFGDNCPYCDALNGKVFGVEQVIIPAGGSFHPEGAERPLTSSTEIRHSPYHGGCDCMSVAG